MGCKIDHQKEERSIRFKQPVMLRSFQDEFNSKKERPKVTPADPGTILVQADKSYVPEASKHKYFRSGVGKLLYMARWSRPDIQNAVRELSKQSQRPTQAHEKAMHRVMRFWAKSGLWLSLDPTL